MVIPPLFEEVFVSDVLGYLDEVAFLAEIPDSKKQLVVAILELLSKADFSCLYADLIFSVAFKNLEEAELFACVFFEDVPVLNEINQQFHLNLCCSLKIKEIWRLQRTVFPQTLHKEQCSLTGSAKNSV